MGVARHRVTVMFRATMPLEMERIAKRYLRHPSVISVGDKDSSKNALSLPQGIIIVTYTFLYNILRYIYVHFP
jgi:superfamily II DNA/RNA helicase